MATTLTDTLRMMDAKDETGMENLAEAVRLRGLAEAAEAVSLVHGKDKPLAGKALGVVLNLGPLALDPLLDSLDPEDPAACAVQLHHAVGLELEQRRKTAAALGKLLEDKRLVPMPRPIGGAEEKPRKRRLCDEAYLALRKLLSMDESEDAQLMNERMFLDMAEADRDKEIGKMRKSGRFTPLLEYFPGE